MLRNLPFWEFLVKLNPIYMSLRSIEFITMHYTTSNTPDRNRARNHPSSHLLPSLNTKTMATLSRPVEECSEEWYSGSSLPKRQEMDEGASIPSMRNGVIKEAASVSFQELPVRKESPSHAKRNP
jgi:hypothetical protein